MGGGGGVVGYNGGGVGRGGGFSWGIARGSSGGVGGVTGFNWGGGSWGGGGGGGGGGGPHTYMGGGGGGGGGLGGTGFGYSSNLKFTNKFGLMRCSIYSVNVFAVAMQKLAGHVRFRYRTAILSGSSIVSC